MVYFTRATELHNLTITDDVRIINFNKKIVITGRIYAPTDELESRGKASLVIIAQEIDLSQCWIDLENTPVLLVATGKITLPPSKQDNSFKEKILVDLAITDNNKIIPNLNEAYYCNTLNLTKYENLERHVQKVNSGELPKCISFHKSILLYKDLVLVALGQDVEIKADILAAIKTNGINKPFQRNLTIIADNIDINEQYSIYLEGGLLELYAAKKIQAPLESIQTPRTLISADNAPNNHKFTNNDNEIIENQPITKPTSSSSPKSFTTMIQKSKKPIEISTSITPQNVTNKEKKSPQPDGFSTTIRNQRQRSFSSPPIIML
ncbi:hypothetical protein [Rickettsiales endosymbiont of Stachyamoeba lipophora]|uniref:hypothetical protein n=1 Tax=Rickettsiales endosymbiont of Stachyamoeba lipophora TaxID=2486578 RepID=UPI000F646704|nr:hypothetical protein [Rickettsiales endosymbiont of Stachyamoeba lipophora]AZL16158.1 hypothetical protein EF513_06390 [Rickettsiales endosymbiont of Stachyamoeba lipophora]